MRPLKDNSQVIKHLKRKILKNHFILNIFMEKGIR